MKTGGIPRFLQSRSALRIRGREWRGRSWRCSEVRQGKFGKTRKAQFWTIVYSVFGYKCFYVVGSNLGLLIFGSELIRKRATIVFLSEREASLLAWAIDTKLTFVSPSPLDILVWHTGVGRVQLLRWTTGIKEFGTPDFCLAAFWINK